MSDESHWEADNAAAVKLHEQGRYAEAEPLFLSAPREAERSGEKDIRCATVLNNLANLYHNQEKYEQAEPLYRKALAIRKDLFGAQHPLVAQSLNNLAALSRDQGNHTEAEALFRQSLAIKEATLGPRHISVTNSLNNLGAVPGAEPVWRSKSLVPTFSYH